MGTAQESRYLSSRDDVAQVFRFFRDQQSEIKLRFNSAALGVQSFTARVLELTNDQVLLQNIIPRNGIEHLQNGEAFSISGRADGLFVYISDNSVIANRTSGNSAAEGSIAGCVRIALPSTVLYQQRRRSERVRLPVQANSHRSHIRLGDITPLYGRILDISAHGAKIRIEQAREDSIRKDQRLENCAVNVPNQLSIEASYIVRHALFNDAQQTMTCGLELLSASPEALAELASFVAKISNPPL